MASNGAIFWKWKCLFEIWNIDCLVIKHLIWVCFNMSGPYQPGNQTPSQKHYFFQDRTAWSKNERDVCNSNAMLPESIQVYKYNYIIPPLPPLSHTCKNCDLVSLQQILFHYSLPASAQLAGLDTPTLAQRFCPWVPAPGEGGLKVVLIPSTSARSDPEGPEWKLPDGHRYEWTPDESSSVDHHKNPPHILRDAALVGL